jgi:hypothetical protein
VNVNVERDGDIIVPPSSMNVTWKVLQALSLPVMKMPLGASHLFISAN